MKKEDFDDLLVDSVLPEAIGMENPPDVLARVMAKARQRRRHRLWRWASAAACALIAAGFFWHWTATRQATPRQPVPETVGMLMASGSLPRPVQRGEHVSAAGESLLQYAGGDIEVRFYPGCEALVQGDTAVERLRLCRGAVHCRVASAKPRPFVVETAMGTASVKGTEFFVQIVEEKEERKERDMFKRMVVCVFAGTVAVTAAATAEEVKAEAGVAVTVAADGTTTVIQIGDTALANSAISLTPNGNATFVRYPGMDEKTQCQFDSLRIRERLLQEKQLAIEMKTVETPAVMQSAKAMDEAIASFRQALMANKEYIALAQERDNLQKEQRDFWVGARKEAAGDPNAMQERHKRWAALFQRLNELNQRIATFADEVPELAALKKKQDEAILGFAQALQQALAGNAEYMALVQQIDFVRKAMQDLQTRQIKVVQPGAVRFTPTTKPGGAGEGQEKRKENAVF